ncbi:hypothetical protein J6590_028727 [Homalodisca vitripennis]|nr:hypothetical protein J6590_028727 [Homalodisca vitripennis]
MTDLGESCSERILSLHNQHQVDNRKYMNNRAERYLEFLSSWRHVVLHRIPVRTFQIFKLTHLKQERLKVAMAGEEMRTVISLIIQLSIAAIIPVSPHGMFSSFGVRYHTAPFVHPLSFKSEQVDCDGPRYYVNDRFADSWRMKFNVYSVRKTKGCKAHDRGTVNIAAFDSESSLYTISLYKVEEAEPADHNSGMNDSVIIFIRMEPT